jgi:spoIIIJ-associated protein
MVGIFGKIFGKKKENATENLVNEQLSQLIKLGKFELNFNVEAKKNSDDIDEVFVNLSGNDKRLLTDKDGMLLESFHSFLKRVVRNKTGSENFLLKMDCDGFKEDTEKALIVEAEALKNKVLELGKSFYFKPLSPKDRKTVHQYLSSDERVKSRSVGDGLFKKIKIYPSKTDSLQKSNAIE